MVRFKGIIEQFGEKGEKTGWTFVRIPAVVADQIRRGQKASFRVKGRLDRISIKGIALLPMGDGNFMLTLNADLRKKLSKRKGDPLELQLADDKEPFQINSDLVECLEDEPVARSFFESLPASHQRYFSKWIDSAKTDGTKTKRIALCVNALNKKWGYGEMIRAQANKGPAES